MGKLSSTKLDKASIDVDGSEEEQLTVLHRAKFVDWSPTAVVALALTDDSSCVAVARESGAIELWDTDSWHCLLVRPVCQHLLHISITMGSVQYGIIGWDGMGSSVWVYGIRMGVWDHQMGWDGMGRDGISMGVWDHYGSMGSSDGMAWAHHCGISMGVWDSMGSLCSATLSALSSLPMLAAGTLSSRLTHFVPSTSPQKREGRIAL